MRQNRGLLQSIKHLELSKFFFASGILLTTVCSRSLDPSYYTNWIKTWKCSIWQFLTFLIYFFNDYHLFLTLLMTGGIPNELWRGGGGANMTRRLFWCFILKIKRNTNFMPIQWLLLCFNEYFDFIGIFQERTESWREGANTMWCHITEESNQIKK